MLLDYYLKLIKHFDMPVCQISLPNNTYVIPNNI